MVGFIRGECQRSWAMLQASRINRPVSDVVSEEDFSSLLDGALGLIRRRRAIIVGSMLVALAIATGYVLSVPSIYTATATVVIDPLADPLRQSASQRANTGIQSDPATVDTQVEILRSDSIALAVIRTLALDDELQIGQRTDGTRGNKWDLLAEFFSAIHPPPKDVEQRALAQFRKRLSVRRVGMSNVIEVSFRSESASQSAQTANSIVSAYLDNQRNAKLQASRDATAWLKERISELSQQTVSIESILRDVQPGRAVKDGQGAADQRHALRSAYNSLLQRLISIQYEAFPSADARVISAATEPTSRSYPHSPLILSGALGIGLVFGLGAAFIADRLDRTFRNGSQVETILHMPLLGVLPKIRTEPRLTPIAPLPNRFRLARPAKPAAAAKNHSDRNLLCYAASEPFSSFVEELRSMKLELGLATSLASKRVIGFTSALQGEGKTTIASNFAQLLMISGHRVILVETDLRNVPESRGIATSPVVGLWDVLTGQCPVERAVFGRPECGTHFISVGSRIRVPEGTDLLSSPKMQATMNILKDRYDVVVLDLPPLLRLVDLKALEPLIDRFVLVIEWGRTRINDLQGASETEALRYKWAGVLLNKADVRYFRN
jgi:polysaccharide biosynthesis transport protein